MTRGVVSSGHQATSEAAAEVLRAGGNAFDAALAAIMTSTVAEPILSSLGGGGFMLARPAGGEPVLIDFFSETPLTREDDCEFYPIHGDFGSTVQEFHIGMGSVAVPGLPAGLSRIHERFATMPLPELAAPAVKVGREGIAFNAFQHHILEILSPIVDANAAVQELYCDVDGNRLTADAMHVQAGAADTLETLAREGARWFYEGDMADMIGALSSELGGHLCPADLRGYTVKAREPLAWSIGDAQLATNPPPSMGGTLICHALGALELLDAPDLPLSLRLALAMETTSVARRESRVQFNPTTEAAAALLDKTAIGEMLARVKTHRLARSATTQISVVDADGNVASTTLSNGEGSGCVVPGTGVHLNNFLGEEDLTPQGPGLWTPGQRLSSMMAPTVVRRGDTLLALGSGGSNRLRTAILQVLVRVFRNGMALEEAIPAPRLHFERGVLYCEPGIEGEEFDALAGTFENIERFQRPSLFFGGVHAAALGPDGVYGASDPRRGGVTLVV